MVLNWKPKDNLIFVHLYSIYWIKLSVLQILQFYRSMMVDYLMLQNYLSFKFNHSKKGKTDKLNYLIEKVILSTLCTWLDSILDPNQDKSFNQIYIRSNIKGKRCKSNPLIIPNSRVGGCVCMYERECVLCVCLREREWCVFVCESIRR